MNCIALQNQIVNDGDTPWCIGIGSGAATGWPATDWTEDMMLRTTSLENYDKWVRGELKFDSPEVKKAIKTVRTTSGPTMRTCLGGRKADRVTNFVQRSGARCSTNPPKCWLHRQANFITSFFPTDAKYGTDYDFLLSPAGLTRSMASLFWFPATCCGDERQTRDRGRDAVCVNGRRDQGLAGRGWHTGTAE